MSRIDQDRQLYETLVRLHAAEIYRYVLRLCGDRDVADDLVQETFCEAWRSIGSLKEPQHAKAWLFGIARHRNAHRVRRRTRRIRTDNESQIEGMTDQAGPDILERLSDQNLLQTALNGLEDRYKEPFLLVFLEDFTCREVSEMLELPLGTVLSRIHRARQMLRRTLRQLDPTEPHGNANRTVIHDR